MNLEEKQLTGNTVFNGKIIRLNVDEVELPDGTRSTREYIKHSGGAATLLIQDGAVLLVRQFRYAYGKATYEIPAGKLNVDEDPEIAALRELEEETGYRAKLIKIFDLYPSPGYTDEIIHIYFAKDYEFVGQKLDDGEFLNVEFIPLEKVLCMIEGGEICDAKTVSSVFYYLSKK